MFDNDINYVFADVYRIVSHKMEGLPYYSDLGSSYRNGNHKRWKARDMKKKRKHKARQQKQSRKRNRKQ